MLRSEKMAESHGVRLSPSNHTFRIKLMKTVSFCSQDRIIGRPHNPYTPVTRQAQQGWFESWFNHSPWLTTLISTLVGPIAMILTLIFGPCILNTLVSFVKSQLEKVNMLVEHQQLLKECIYSVLSPVIPSYTSL